MSVVLLDVPGGSLVGIDYIDYSIGGHESTRVEDIKALPRAFGFRGLQPGAHLLFFHASAWQSRSTSLRQNSTTNEEQTNNTSSSSKSPLRSSFLFFISHPSEVRVYRWDSKAENLVQGPSNIIPAATNAQSALYSTLLDLNSSSSSIKTSTVTENGGTRKEYTDLWAKLSDFIDQDTVDRTIQLCMTSETQGLGLTGNQWTKAFPDLPSRIPPKRRDNSNNEKTKSNATQEQTKDHEADNDVQLAKKNILLSEITKYAFDRSQALCTFLTSTLPHNHIPTPSITKSKSESIAELAIEKQQAQSANQSRTDTNQSRTDTNQSRTDTNESRTETNESRIDDNTAHSLSRSLNLNLNLRMEDVPKHCCFTALLSYLQMSFLIFVQGQSLHAFEFWKGILALICQSEALFSCTNVLDVHNFVNNFTIVLSRQLEVCPRDLFIDPLSKRNFLVPLLKSFKQIVGRTYFQNLSKILRTRFHQNEMGEEGKASVDGNVVKNKIVEDGDDEFGKEDSKQLFRLDDDDEGPVIVDLNAAMF
eukprot:g3772.t1